MISTTAASAQRNLPLPPDREQDGLYIITDDLTDAGLLVRHRFTGHVQAIPRDKLPAFEEVSDLALVANWSELRAALSSKTDEVGTHALKLVHFFP